MDDFTEVAMQSVKELHKLLVVSCSLGIATLILFAWATEKKPKR